MWIAVDHAGKISLEDAGNFKMFKLVIACDLDQARAALKDLADIPGAEHAWVSEAGLRGFVKDEAWQESLSAMIEKARPHGWVHPDTGAIRAHIETV
jgi:hypothetical protein